MIELGRDQRRRIRIEHLVDGRHHAHAHQFFYDLASFDAHFSGQICHGYYFGDLDDPLARFRNCDLGFPDLFAR